MSRKMLALPLFAALAFVGCDDSSSSSASGSPSAGICDGYTGTWALDSFAVMKSGDTLSFRYEYTFGPSVFRFQMVQTGFTGKVDLLVKKDTGSLQDLGGSKLLVTPKAAWTYDWKDTTLKAGVPAAADTITYSNPSKGVIVLEGIAGSGVKSVSLTCR